MRAIDSLALENLAMKKIIDHSRAPSRVVRDQIVEMAIQQGLTGWMPITKTDPRDQFHYSWPCPQHPQIDRVRSNLGRWLGDSMIIQMFLAKEKHAAIIEAIQQHLSPELLLPKYRQIDGVHPLAGHCYVASEAFYHLAGGKRAGLKPMQINHEDVSHWFIQDDYIQDKILKVIDITAAQFQKPVSYDQAVGRGFLTKNPSKRAQKLIDLVLKKNALPCS